MARRISAEARAPYLPFEDGRFEIAMGLGALSDAAWIEIDGNLASDLALKRRLIETRRGEVFAALPASEAPAAELLALLARDLPLHHPSVFARAGDRLTNRATGESWDIADGALHPLELCGRLVQEDFCLMAAQEGVYRLVGGMVCFPSRWRLADKIGKTLDAIHAPVPFYRERLGQPVERFFAGLKSGKLVSRLNWSIHDDPAPFQPVRVAPEIAVTVADAGERLWLRVERQTLRRLPASEAVVFTIRTYITRLDRAIADGALALALSSALAAMPPETKLYKSIAPFEAALTAWLASRA